MAFENEMDGMNAKCNEKIATGKIQTQKKWQIQI